MGEMPDVSIHAVRLVVLCNRNAMLLRICDLSRAGVKIPLTPRGDDLKVRCERLYGQLKAHLIVPLACCAMCNRVGTLALGDIDKCLCNHGTCKRRTKQILSLVDRARLECRPDILLEELPRQIDDVHLRGTGGKCLVMHRIEFLTLPDIGTDSNNFTTIIMLLQPRNDNRGIKTTRIRKNYLFDLLCHI